MALSPLKRSLAACLLAGLAGAAMGGELVVSAASSLANAFKDIAQAYEAQHPGTQVLLNFGASGALLQQMAKGAPVDVFASADQETMDAAQKQGLVATADRKNFVRNQLVLIVPTDAKTVPAQLGDLTQPSFARIAIAHPASVPAGRYAQTALQAANLWPAVQSKAIPTQNVRQSLDYVARGEVDAGFVYATDAALVKNKVRLAFQVPLDKPILYPIATTTASRNAAAATSFVQYLATPAAQAILARYGFGRP